MRWVSGIRSNWMIFDIYNSQFIILNSQFVMLFSMRSALCSILSYRYGHGFIKNRFQKKLEGEGE
jgi:hypothetical protein